MSETSVQRETAFDPFGEPMDPVVGGPDGKGYGETRRAAIVFWALALLIVGSRIYLSEPSMPQITATADAVALQVAGLR